MEPNKRFHIRINNENFKPFSKVLEGPLSERSEKEQKLKAKSNKNNVHLFHKRNNTAITDLT
jgi:hypothetical protein